MKILIVGLVENPQVKRLKEETKKKGHTLDGCHSWDLSILAKNDSFKPILKDKDITSYDLIYLWATRKRRWEWYTTAYFLNYKYKTKIVNHKIIDREYLMNLSPVSDYLKQVEQNLPFPKSAVILSEEGVEEVLEEFSFPFILKLSGGRQGKGVFLIEDKITLLEKIEEFNDTNQAYILREFIPNDGDIRIFCVGYKAIGAMKRIPPEGDFRSNISQGGKGEEYDLDKNPEIKTLAEKISEMTKTEIAGVDIIIDKETKKPYILEINPGPQFTGLEKFTSTNAALKIIEYFEKLV